MARADGEPSIVVAGPANEGNGVFSPDGRWLAYDANEGGLGYVFLEERRGRGGEMAGLRAGWARTPAGSRDGTLYLPAPGRVDRVDPRHRRRGALPSSGRRKRLFPLDSYDIGTRIALGWDVSRTASGFSSFFARAARRAEVNHVTLVSDFAEELKRLAPAGGK